MLLSALNPQSARGVLAGSNLEVRENLLYKKAIDREMVFVPVYAPFVQLSVGIRTGLVVRSLYS